MDDFVRKMHTKSGLLPEIERSDGRPSPTPSRRTLDYVQQHVPTPARAPLCGNSIGTDRRFLDRYMHELDDYLHYRSIDVSSLKELCRRWYPGDLPQAARQGGAPPRPRRHPRVDRRAALLPRAAVHSRRSQDRAAAAPRRVVMSATAGSATTTPSWPESLAR